LKKNSHIYAKLSYLLPLGVASVRAISVQLAPQLSVVAAQRYDTCWTTAHWSKAVSCPN